MKLKGRVWNRRAMESAAMMMIGEGVLGTVCPVRHCLLWQRGPAAWKRLVSFFVRHPAVTRAVAVAETGAGLWLALRQTPRSSRALRV